MRRHVAAAFAIFLTASCAPVVPKADLDTHAKNADVLGDGIANVQTAGTASDPRVSVSAPELGKLEKLAKLLASNDHQIAEGSQK